MAEWLHKYPRVAALLQGEDDVLEGASSEAEALALPAALLEDLAIYGEYRVYEAEDGSLRRIPPAEWRDTDEACPLSCRLRAGADRPHGVSPGQAALPDSRTINTLAAAHLAWRGQS
jgi:hypothetical protein